jgi:redox-sensitive bicupin YhaK (pirin superfamily)
MGNAAVIKEGDIQAMSAGTGVSHSERNKNQDTRVKFLQIWVLPNKVNVTPRYDQITLEKNKLKDQFMQIISPDPGDDGIWIHQQAWFHLGEFSTGTTASYSLKNKENGLYVFLLEGNCQVADEELNRRDGLGIWEVDAVTFKIKATSKILLMEVPMGN